MLSLPDFREKQIVYLITSQEKDQKLQFWNDNIRLLEEGKPVNQISCARVFAVFIIGDFTITSKLICQCKEFGISLFLLKHNFQVYAEIISEAEGNYVLRERQYKLSNELSIAKRLVANKVYNQYQLLRRVRKQEKPISKYKKARIAINKIKNRKSLLGLEGSYTKKYFSAYFKEYNWYKRQPRAKQDITNVLMDIGYTFLFNFIEALLRLYGFDTYKGIYHQLFFQRKSLACDIMEPFRCLIDKQIRKAYRLKQINKKNFTVQQGAYQLSYQNQQKYLEMFFTCIMARKEDLFCYVRDFYYAIFNQTSKFPFFKIENKIFK